MEKIHFNGTCDKDALSYKVNEPITFTVMPVNSDGSPAVRDDIMFYKWTVEGDDTRYETGYLLSLNKPLILTTRLSRPGFVRVIVEACDGNKTPITDIIRFEGGAGAEVEKINLSTKIPDDFDEFWSNALKLVNEADTSSAEMIHIESTEECNTYKVKIPTPFGNPAMGILTVPKDETKKYDAKINFCGYGVAQTPVICEKDAINLIINAHGIEPDAPEEYYKELFKEPGGKLFYYGFDNIENSSPYTTYFYGMMIRNLTALRFLKTLPQWNGKTLVAKGGSQGALQATTVAAHDDDVTLLDISIPWFCNLAGYKDGRKEGWEGRIRGWSPDYTVGLCYYDTAVQATRVKCPVKIMARLGDYTCPPSGIMALYNGLKTEKEIIFCQNGTHGYESPNHTKYTLKKGC